jgi:hypothetical protein
MSLHDTPERYWDYAIEYAVELINHMAVERLHGEHLLKSYMETLASFSMN